MKRSKGTLGYLVSLVLTLCAFSSPPVFAGTSEGLGWLSTQQNVDGSFGGNGNSLANPIQTTSELLRAYQDLSLSSQTGFAAGLTFINSSTDTDSELLSRQIVINARAGNDVSALIATLLANQDTAGGFGDQPTSPSSVLSSAFALDALATTNYKASQQASAAIFYLLAQQQADGSWLDGSAVSSAYVTALAMRSLWYYRQIYPQVSPALDAAKNFLLSSRDSNGSWGESFISAQALIALIAYLPDLSSVTNSIATLQSRQLADGSWEDDAFTTALVLRALNAASQTQTNPDLTTIRGQVVDADTGAGLGGVTLNISGPTTRSLTTVADGSFLADGLGAGSYTLQLTLSNYSPFATTTVTSSGQATDLGVITLKQLSTSSTASVSGTIRDATTGHALGGVTVTATGAPSPATSNADGTYVIANVPPGTVTVTAALSGYTSASITSSLTAGAMLVFSPNLQQGSAQDTGVVTGTVVNGATGLPLSGVTVNAVGDRFTASGSTDVQGSYRIEGVRAGAYTLSATLAGFDTASAQANVYQGSTVTFSPRLYLQGTTPQDANTASVTGTVVDSSTGLPLSGVSLQGSFGTSTYAVVTDAAGDFNVTGITAADGSLTFSHNGYQSRYLFVTVQPASALDMGSVRLTPQGVSALLPDLVVKKVDGSGTTTDPATLTISGTVSASIANEGYATAKAGFSLLAFYDVNLNGVYDAGTDVALGQATVGSDFNQNAVQDVSIAVSGKVAFRDAPISVWVDNAQVIPEINESNNVAASGTTSCSVTPSARHHYAYNPGDQGLLSLTGYTDNSTYTIRPLPTGTPISGTVNRMQRKDISLSGIRHFVLDTSVPMLAVTGNPDTGGQWGQYSGSLFYPATDGNSWYGTSFIISPNCASSVSQTVIFAREPAVVTVTNASGTVVATSPVLPANGVWLPTGLGTRGVYNVSSTGSIAIANNSGNGYTQVPPIPIAGQQSDFHNDAGTDFYFATYAWGYGGVGDIAVMNASPVAAVFTITNLSNGAVVVSNQTLLPGAVYYRSNMGTAYYHLTTTSGQVEVWAGDNEGGTSIAYMGDDISLNAGEHGKRFALNTQSMGGYIYAGQDQTTVSINDQTPTTLNHDQFLPLSPGQVVSISTSNPVTVEIMGGNVINDWATTLRPVYGSPVPGADLTASLLQIVDHGTGLPASLTLRVGNAGAVPSPAGVLVTFYQGDPAGGGVSLGSLSLPAIANGAYQDVRLDNVMLSGTADIYAIVDETNQLNECNEANNSMHTAIAAAPSLGKIAIATDQTMYAPNSPVQIGATVTNPGSFPGSYTTTVQIEDANGASVTAFPPQAVASLNAGANTTIGLTWNTGTILAGAYRVHAFLYGQQGELLNEASSNFTIGQLSSQGPVATLFLATDRTTYYSTDLVNIDGLVANHSVSTLIGSASLRITVTDPSGQVVFTNTGILGQLLPSSLREVVLPYTLAGAAVATYHVHGDLVDTTSTTLATADTQFDVRFDLMKALSGKVEVALPSLEVGTAQTCTDTLTNQGTITAAGIEVHHALLNLDTQQLVNDQTATLTLATTASNQATRSLTTTSLVPGHYACAILVRTGTALNTVAYTPFELKVPPVRIDADLTLGKKGRLLVLLDSGRRGDLDDQDQQKDDRNSGKVTCDGVKSLSLAASFATPLSNAATVSARVLGHDGQFIDQESMTLANYVGSVDLSAGSNGANLVLDALTPQRLQLTIQPFGTPKLGSDYAVEVTIVDGNTVQLSSGTIHTDCSQPLTQGQPLGVFTVSGVDLVPAANDSRYRDADPYGPAGAPGLKAQRAFLETLLHAAGWSYTITDTADDFTRELRTGGYTDYAVFSESEKLDEQVQKELREATFRGEGLVVAGIHDARLQKLLDALGIKLIGRTQANGVDLTASALSLAGHIELMVGDDTLRIKRFHASSAGLYTANAPQARSDGDDCHDQATHYDSIANKQDHSHDDECEGHPERYLDAVTINDYGNGKSMFVGFDLLATATRDGQDSLAASLLKEALGYVNPSDLPKGPGAVVPLTLTLTNRGIATGATATVNLPAGTMVADPGSGTVSGNALSFETNLAVGDQESLTFWVKLPQAAGPVTFQAVVTVPNLAQPAASVSYTVAVDQLESLSSIDGRLQALTANGVASEPLHRAEDSVAQAMKQTLSQREAFELLKATDALLGISDPTVSDIRTAIDRRIRIRQQ